MRFVDLTLPSAAENIALDEALLEEAEAAGEPHEVLRLWEPSEPLVVVGRSSQVALEVNLATCEERGIPVLRRSSGGAAIVTGPGCLMYGVVLSYERRPALRSLDEAHRFVLGTTAAALARLCPGIEHQGTSDLTIGGLKFSGNSVRCKRTHLLYHGTILYRFPLESIGACLTMPPRQPEYRQGRAHQAFVTNLPAGKEAIRDALTTAWCAVEDPHWPATRVRELVAEKYRRADWNLRM